MIDGMMNSLYTIQVGGDGARVILAAFLDHGERSFTIIQGEADGSEVWQPLAINMGASDLVMMDAVFPVLMGKYNELVEGSNATVAKAMHLEGFLEAADKDPSLLDKKWVMGTSQSGIDTLRSEGVEYQVMPPEKSGPFGDLGKGGTVR